MLKKILLNNSEFQFTENDLPTLIHGASGAGSSLFTISLLSQLYKEGAKILFFSGYEMAKDEFRSQVETLDMNRVEIVKRGAGEDLIKTAANLKDLNERIVLLKNVELLDGRAFQLIKNHKKIIVSGDIEKCSFKDDLLNFSFKTTVLFSPLETKTLPALQQYEGYMTGANEGRISVKVRA